MHATGFVSLYREWYGWGRRMTNYSKKLCIYNSIQALAFHNFYKSLLSSLKTTSTRRPGISNFSSMSNKIWWRLHFLNDLQFMSYVNVYLSKQIYLLHILSIQLDPSLVYMTGFGKKTFKFLNILNFGKIQNIKIYWLKIQVRRIKKLTFKWINVY